MSEAPPVERDEDVEENEPVNDAPYGWLLHPRTSVWQIVGVLAVCLGIAVGALFDPSAVLEHRKGPIALVCAPVGIVVCLLALVRAARRRWRN